MKSISIDSISSLARDTASRGIGLRLMAFDPLKLVAASAGIAVAVLVMFVELGLLNGILDAQSRLAALVRGDLIITSAQRSNLHQWGDIDRIRLYQLAALDGVAEVIPVYEGGMVLRNPPDQAVHRIIGFAFPANTMPLAIGDEAQVTATLQKSNAILFDRRSRPIYGSVQPGGSVLLNEKPYDVGGLVDIGPDIIIDGAVVMSENAWLANDPYAQPIMGVVRLAKGLNPRRTRDRLLRQMPDDVSLLTPAEAQSREVHFTLRSAPIGIIFGIGLVAGIVIGATICYQILFNEIFDMARAFGTLRAMGFSDSFFRRLLVEQALLLALGGLCVGTLLSWIAYRVLTSQTCMVIGFGVPSFLSVAAFTIFMTLAASVMALRQLWKLDIADLY